jgi:cardiolipin synthase
VLKAANNGARVCISVDRYGVVLEKSEESRKSFFHKKQTLTEKLKSKALAIGYPKNCPKGKIKDEETELYKSIMFHPNITVSKDVFKADHSKYYIIDDEILFVGGINIEDKENGCDIIGREYGDYMVKMAGRDYVDTFKAKLSSGKNTDDTYFFGVNLKKPNFPMLEMEHKYLDLINRAEKRLHITMAYFSPLKKFTDAIISAYNRGVDVSIVIPMDANYQDDTNKKTVKKLLKATNDGIRVYYSPRMLHTKLVATDNEISFGSTNITKKAFNQLSELNLFVNNIDCPFCTRVWTSIEHDIDESKRIASYKDVRYNKAFALVEGFLV